MVHVYLIESIPINGTCISHLKYPDKWYMYMSLKQNPHIDYNLLTYQIGIFVEPDLSTCSWRIPRTHVPDKQIKGGTMDKVVRALSGFLLQWHHKIKNLKATGTKNYPS